VSGSASFGSYSSSYSSGGMSGISIGLGIAGLVMALIGVDLRLLVQNGHLFLDLLI
jgi:hypothetical protein